jgi:hypothetical protein
MVSLSNHEPRASFDRLRMSGGGGLLLYLSGKVNHCRLGKGVCYNAAAVEEQPPLKLRFISDYI